MKIRAMMLTVFASTAIAAGAVAAQETPAGVRVYRSWQADSSLTLVEGLFRVDPEVLGTTDCDYTATIDIKDATGKLLNTEKWDGKCPVVNGATAAALERFAFAMPPGTTFSVDMTLQPKSSPDAKKVRTVQVRSLGERALLSDLILAKQVGYVENNASQWNMKRGGIGIRAATEMALDPSLTEVAYYLELYPPANRPFNGAAYMVIRDAKGIELTRRSLQQLTNVKEPQPLAGKANLAGLSEGDYTFEVVLQLADTTVAVAHPFTMAPAAVVAAGPGTGYFYTMTDAEIESTFSGVVVYGMKKADIDMYNSLSTTGKRAFLTQYFGSEGPTGRKPESFLDAYMNRIKVVNARYSERAGRGKQEGWRTDRGRIYLQRGEPTNQASRASPREGGAYEVFYYANSGGLFYLFVDDTRMGNYRLVYTNDPNEQGIRNWDRLVGQQAIEDMRSMGIRVIIENAGSSQL